MDNEALARATIGMTDEDLYAQLGAELLGKSAVSLRRAEAIEQGQRWLLETSKQFTSDICSSSKVRALGRQDLETHERVVLICAIADIMIAQVHGVTVVTAAALLVRQGLHRLCAGHWSTNAKHIPAGDE